MIRTSRCLSKFQCDCCVFIFGSGRGLFGSPPRRSRDFGARRADGSRARTGSIPGSRGNGVRFDSEVWRTVACRRTMNARETARVRINSFVLCACAREDRTELASNRRPVRLVRLLRSADGILRSTENTVHACVVVQCVVRRARARVLLCTVSLVLCVARVRVYYSFGFFFFPLPRTV